MSAWKIVFMSALLWLACCLINCLHWFYALIVKKLIDTLQLCCQYRCWLVVADHDVSASSLFPQIGCINFSMDMLRLTVNRLAVSRCLHSGHVLKFIKISRKTFNLRAKNIPTRLQKRPFFDVHDVVRWLLSLLFWYSGAIVNSKCLLIALSAEANNKSRKMIESTKWLKVNFQFA